MDAVIVNAFIIYNTRYLEKNYFEAFSPISDEWASGRKYITKATWT